jgi:putative membrane protein
MHPLIKCSVALVIGISTNAALAETQTTKASKADEIFIKEAMEGDLAEVSLGKLAQEKSQSQGVKEFGIALASFLVPSSTVSL